MRSLYVPSPLRTFVEGSGRMNYDEIQAFVETHEYEDFARIAIYAEVRYEFADDGLTEEEIRDVTERIYQEYLHSSDGFDFISFTWKVKEAYNEAEDQEDWDDIFEKALLGE